MSIGTPTPRLDGAAKVTGRAKYAGEEHSARMLHAVLVHATIASGRVMGIDASAAGKVSGVIRVLTRENMPKLAPAPVPPVAEAATPFQTDQVRYEGQAVAVVLAETLEAAEEAAAHVHVEYARETPQMFAAAPTTMPRTEQNGYVFLAPDTNKGDFDAAWSAAHARIDATYESPSRHHNPMEPSATLAEWRGDELHMHSATQWGHGVRYALAGVFGIEPTKVHIRCPYTGGGFGSKGYTWPHQLIAAMAARVVGRPVKLNIGRLGMYTTSGYQPAVINRVRLAAGADGKLTAVGHETTNITSMSDDYVEFASAGTRALYATPSLMTRTRIRRCNVGTPTAMRAPHEGPGSFAMESAMDELALALDLDPLELRLRNYAETDPSDGRPFSSKKLREAYAEGAKRFGWEKRPRAPRSLRNGDLMIGQGMASGIMSTFRFSSAARATLESDGSVTLRSAAQEIGTGAYTVLPQVAAEVLGIPVSRVRLILGDTSLPETAPTTGSTTTMSVGSAVKDACEKLRAKVAQLAPGAKDFSTALRERGTDPISADGVWKPTGDVAFDATGGKSPYSMHTWSAIFVEVSVDEALGLVRLRRAVAGYSAGRIVNPLTARSQMIGGLIWGVGQALLEESAMDDRYGRYLSKNLSGVMLPVNADIPTNIDVFFVDEYDPHASAIGARGIGELGATGVAAAIANAVWHATGKRVRRLPVGMADVLAPARI
jgi:xanthine dehydrogenase YagR molybdenum-binding subunit